jgi:Major Facilitator Superfamily
MVSMIAKLVWSCQSPTITGLNKNQSEIKADMTRDTTTDDPGIAELASAESAIEPVSHEANTAEANNDNNVVDSPREKWQRRRAVAIYMVTLAFLYADMNLLAPNLSDIADEFGFDDDERDRKLGGQIAVAFFLVGAPVSFLVGWLADSHQRAPLFAAIVFFGELGCFITYFTTTYTGLFICRVWTGIAVGGSLPIIFSVLGDLYKAGNRAAIAAVVATGTGVGIAMGQSLAGFLGDKYGWRMPFLVVSIPAFFLALLVLTVEEPERGGKEAARLEIEAERRRLAGLTSEAAVEGPAPVAGNAMLADADDVGDETIVDEHKSSSESSTFGKKRFESEEDQPEQSLNNGGESEVDERSRVSMADSLQVSDLRTGARTPSAFEKDATDYISGEVSWKSTAQLLRTPSMILILLQGAPGALPFGMTSVYLNDYLAEDRGMTKEVRNLEQRVRQPSALYTNFSWLVFLTIRKQQECLFRLVLAMQLESFLAACLDTCRIVGTCVTHPLSWASFSFSPPFLCGF